MTAFPLPSSSPSAEGVDARGILAFVDAVEAAGCELHSLAVARHGRVVAAGWWAPYAASQRPLVYSLSKSLTATAVGFLVDEGRLSVEDRIVDRLGAGPGNGGGAGLGGTGLDLRDVDPVWQDVRVRHALSMTLGHGRESIVEAEDAAYRLAGEGRPEPVLAGILATPPDRAPGSVFAYNQPATALLARVVESVAGTPVSEVLRTRLLEPLGLPPIGWQRDDDGHEIGYSGAHVPTATVLALAQLYLGGGVIGGRRFLSPEWVAEATVGQGPAREDGEPNPDWTCGYGYSFWQARHGYRGDGAFGQFAIVLPEQDAAIAITSETEDMQGVLDLLWEHLLPAVSDGAAVDPSWDAALAARLDTLALLAPGSTTGGAAPDRASFRRTLPPGVVGEDLRLRVERSGAGWLVGIEWYGERYAVPCGDGAWVTSSVPVGPGALSVAAAGGWRADGRFRAHLRLLDSPHTMLVDGDPSTGEGRIGWRAVPLFGGEPARLIV